MPRPHPGVWHEAQQASYGDVSPSQAFPGIESLSVRSYNVVLNATSRGIHDIHALHALCVAHQWRAGTLRGAGPKVMSEMKEWLDGRMDAMDGWPAVLEVLMLAEYQLRRAVRLAGANQDTQMAITQTVQAWLRQERQGLP